MKIERFWEQFKTENTNGQSYLKQDRVNLKASMNENIREVFNQPSKSREQ